MSASTMGRILRGKPRSARVWARRNRRSGRNEIKDRIPCESGEAIPARDLAPGKVQVDSVAFCGGVGRLRERNVRSLVQMGLRRTDLMDSDALRAACESYEELVGWPRHGERVSLDAIVRAAYNLFRARYRTKADLPGAFLFTDDYLARGALMALLTAGIRTGSDVLVVTLANKGNLPVHPDPLDLILCDPAREADAMADALVAYLDTGAVPGTITLENTFVAGEGE